METLGKTMEQLTDEADEHLSEKEKKSGESIKHATPGKSDILPQDIQLLKEAVSACKGLAAFVRGDRARSMRLETHRGVLSALVMHRLAAPA
jgi:hypothetical protein